MTSRSDGKDERSDSSGGSLRRDGDGTSPNRCDVAIIGAGLTGMSAAHRLGEHGVPYRIVERAARPGGLATTRSEQGYRFDRTGHLLHVDDQAIRQLALDWIGPGVQQIDRRAAIWSHGVYTRYPFQANLHGLPPKVAYECLLGYLQARDERQRKAAERNRPHDFEQFCLQTFGRAISEQFMIPYNSRLWGVPPTEITADWCDRFVPIPALEDVVAGAVGLPHRELGYNARFLYPDEGIGKLTEGLADAIGTIELGRSPRALRAAARQLVFDDELLRYEALVSTMPLPRLIDLCVDAPERVRAAAAELRATPLYYLDVALHRPAARPYHWVYVPEVKYPFYRVGSYSNFSQAMAPAGKGSLYVELVDRATPALAELLPKVTAGLIEMGFLRDAADIAFAQVERIDYAYVVFDHRYQDALNVIEPFLRAHRILSRGRYGAWNYSSMAEAIRFGRDAADECLSLLATTPVRGAR